MRTSSPAGRFHGTLRRAALLSALTLGAGCSSYDAPAIELGGAAVTESSPEGAVISFTIETSNSNAAPLPLRDATYTLELNGARVFSATRSAEATLRRLGTQRIVLPAAVPSSALARLAPGPVEYRLSGSLQYITPGALAELLFDTGVRQPDVSFSKTGTIDLTTHSAPR